jgi:hypothetical protein
LDTTFDNDGRATVGFPQGGYRRAQSVAIDAAGRIIVAGTVEFPMGGTRDFALARYNADGVLAPTFGTGGTASGTPRTHAAAHP